MKREPSSDEPAENVLRARQASAPLRGWRPMQRRGDSEPRGHGAVVSTVNTMLDDRECEERHRRGIAVGASVVAMASLLLLTWIYLVPEPVRERAPSVTVEDTHRVEQTALLGDLTVFVGSLKRFVERTGLHFLATNPEVQALPGGVTLEGDAGNEIEAIGADREVPVEHRMRQTPVRDWE